MSNSRISFDFNVALQEAEKAALAGDVPVGAALYSPKGKCVAKAHNRREQDQDPLAHAEILCLREAAKSLGHWNLNNHVLVVTLEPCPMCLGAIQQARVSQVVYGAQDKKGGSLALGYNFNQDPRMHHRFEVNFEQNERCSSILSDFFQKQRDLKKDKKA